MNYWKYIKPYLYAFILGPIFMIVEVVGEVFMPKLLAAIINEGVGNDKGIGYIIITGILMVILAIIMMLGGVLGAYFATVASSGFANDLRKDVFNRIQDFSFANIDKFSTGSLVTRLTNDITQMQNMIMMMLRMMLRSPGMLIGALIMAFIINARLACIIAVVIPILALALFLIIRVGFPRFNIMQKKLDGLNSTIQEGLTNVRVVKSFVREDFEEDRFDEANHELRDKSLHALKVVIFTFPIMTLAMNVTVLAVVWFGGKQVIVGDMLAGDLTAFTTYVAQILMSLMMLSMIILNSSRALASARRIKEVMKAKIDINDIYAAEKEKKVETGDIEFKNVCFKYYKNNHEWVLENINLKINSGEAVGIIGSTGSGKTSLINLIPRLYDADEGEVYVDGVNVKDYSLNNLRNGVSCVLQKNLLFSGSIIDNLRWGDEDATEEEIIEAAKSAQADGFVSTFTDGYEMELGQGGVNVSGGQKQRLCIARALLKKPKILILDDSTSAVDTATEARIREAFKNDLKDSTKIIIAQRISSVIDADKIVVIDDGRITGVGTHTELINSCEEYKEIYYSQMDKEVTA